MEAKFEIGQLIHHNMFDYRGVIIDVDPIFSGTEEWYEQVAKSKPPKDKPWYHVLVHGSLSVTYVAQRHLESDDMGEPIDHPWIEQFFDGFENGKYIKKYKDN